MNRPYIPKRFLGAFKAGHHPSAREFIDEEFAYVLLKRILHTNYSDIEAVHALDYLTKFNNEYHKAVIKKGDRKALHRKSSLRRERYQANNAKNRDILSMLRFKVECFTNHLFVDSTPQHQEDVMTDLLDEKINSAV